MLDCCWTVSSKCTEYGAQYSANVLNMLDSIQQMYTACWIASSECIERVQILGIFLDYRHQCTSIDKCTWQSSLRLAICTVGKCPMYWLGCKDMDSVQNIGHLFDLLAQVRAMCYCPARPLDLCWIRWNVLDNVQHISLDFHFVQHIL